MCIFLKIHHSLSYMLNIQLRLVKIQKNINYKFYFIFIIIETDHLENEQASSSFSRGSWPLIIMSRPCPRNFQFPLSQIHLDYLFVSMSYSRSLCVNVNSIVKSNAIKFIHKIAHFAKSFK